MNETNETKELNGKVFRAISSGSDGRPAHSRWRQPDRSGLKTRPSPTRPRPRRHRAPAARARCISASSRWRGRRPSAARTLSSARRLSSWSRPRAVARTRAGAAPGRTSGLSSSSIMVRTLTTGRSQDDRHQRDDRHDRLLLSGAVNRLSPFNSRRTGCPASPAPACRAASCRDSRRGTGGAAAIPGSPCRRHRRGRRADTGT